jgi:tellurite resistance protein
MKIDTELTRRMRNAMLAMAEIEQGGAFANPDELTEEQQATLDRVLPIVETLYLVMVADDEASIAEREALRGALQTLTAGMLGEPMIDWMIGHFEQLLADHGREARLERLGAELAKDRDDAEGAFALAAARALADGRVDAAETRRVEEIAGFFGISKRRANAILEGGTEED